MGIHSQFVCPFTSFDSESSAKTSTMNCILAAITVLCLSAAEANIFGRHYGSVSPIGRYASPISAYRSSMFRNPSVMSAPFSKYPSPASLYPMSGIPSVGARYNTMVHHIHSPVSAFPNVVSGIPSMAAGCDITACLIPLEKLERKANISLKFVATDPSLKANICSKLDVSKTCVEGLMTTCFKGLTKATLLKEILSLGINHICMSDVFLSEMACWEHPEMDVIHDKCLAVYPAQEPCSAKKQFRNCIVNEVKSICSPTAATIADIFLVSTLAPATAIKYPGCTIADFPIIPAVGAANLPLLSRAAVSKYY